MRPLDEFEREQAILLDLEVSGRVMVNELTERFGVSRSPSRKDLGALERRDLLLRVRGGAVSSGHTDEGAWTMRVRHSRQAKRAVARAAAELVGHGDVIAMDSRRPATTCPGAGRPAQPRGDHQRAAHRDIADGADQRDGAAAGRGAAQGRRVAGRTIGDLLTAAAGFRRFLRLVGLSPKNGLMDISAEESQTKAFMAGVCDQVYGVFDSSKAERFALHPFVPADRVTGLYTDEGVPPHVVADWRTSACRCTARRCPAARTSRATSVRRPTPQPAERPVVGSGCPVTRAARSPPSTSARRAAGSPPWLRRTPARAGRGAPVHPRPRVVDGILRWDLGTLWGGVRTGLAALDAGPGRSPRSGWTPGRRLRAAPGRRGAGGRADLLPRPATGRRHVGRAGSGRRGELYRAAGVQLIPINTIFGLVADAADRPDRLAAATGLLMMPDLFHYLMSGALTSEYTVASTTGALDTRTGAGMGAARAARHPDAPAARGGAARHRPRRAAPARWAADRRVAGQPGDRAGRRTTRPARWWRRRCAPRGRSSSPPAPGRWSAWRPTGPG